jgi:hypothetical protein
MHHYLICYQGKWPMSLAMNLTGTWLLQVTFHDGPMQGQVERAKVVFQPDRERTCIVLLPDLGAGSWEAQGPAEFSYRLTEILDYEAGGCFGRYVNVQHQGTMSAADAFVSSGTGDLYQADGHFIVRVRTTAVGTRVS